MLESSWCIKSPWSVHVIHVICCDIYHCVTRKNYIHTLEAGVRCFILLPLSLRIWNRKTSSLSETPDRSTFLNKNCHHIDSSWNWHITWSNAHPRGLTFQEKEICYKVVNQLDMHGLGHRADILPKPDVTFTRVSRLGFAAPFQYSHHITVGYI